MTTNSKPDDNSEPKNIFYKLWEILKHPVTALVLAIICSYIFFKLGQSNKSPEFTTGKWEPVINATTNDPRLTILWDGVKVPNVMSKQVAFWNGGSQYIDKKDISLDEPIRIIPQEPIKILNVNIIKVSRDNLKLKPSTEFGVNLNRDVIRIDIEGDEALEEMDGGLFQIVYTGPEDVGFTVTSRIKGAPRGFRQVHWQSVTHNWGFVEIVPVIVFSCLLIIVFFAGLNEIRKREYWEGLKACIASSVFLFLVIYWLTELLHQTPNWMPS